MSAIIERIWRHTCGNELTPDDVRGIQADLDLIALLVDPDRFRASDAYRGIRLLRLAAKCCAPDATVADAVQVAHASLEMAAGSFLAEDYVNDAYLRQEWSAPRVQAEVGLQTRLLQALQAMPGTGSEAIASIRRDFTS